MTKFAIIQTPQADFSMLRGRIPDGNVHFAFEIPQDDLGREFLTTSGVDVSWSHPWKRYSLLILNAVAGKEKWVYPESIRPQT